jgi:catechol 2,3-dioxygenase-like lactoylglutathione lyase family enzyme
VFDHVTIRASDRAAAERFYRTVLEPLGIAPTYEADELVEWDDFSLAAAADGHPPTRRLHLGFVAPSRAHVDEFWRVGTGAGYESDGEPGLRPQYSEDYYGAFLLDPDGNSVEAVHHGTLRRGGNVDHLWIRVSDVHAATRFYETVGPAAGFRVGSELADRTQFVLRRRRRAADGERPPRLQRRRRRDRRQVPPRRDRGRLPRQRRAGRASRLPRGLLRGLRARPRRQQRRGRQPQPLRGDSC